MYYPSAPFEIVLSFGVFLFSDALKSTKIVVIAIYVLSWLAIILDFWVIENGYIAMIGIAGIFITHIGTIIYVRVNGYPHHRW